MNIGTRIRYYRLLRKISPEELTEGITSVSFLSSIENNEQTPSIEMLSQLCDRLEIPFMTYPNEELTQIFGKWKYSLLQNNKEEATLIFKELSSKISPREDIQLIFNYQIYLIRYFIIENQFEKALELIEQIKLFQFELPDELNFSFQKFYGNYLYCTGNFIEASKLFNNAKNYLFSILEYLNEEKADLFYMYGLTLGRINKNTLSIFYIEEALALFQQIYQMKRCTDCHMMLGLIYSRMQDYDEAEKNYIIAKQLAASLKYYDLLNNIENNLGLLKAKQDKSEEAIEHYLNSYSNHTKSDDQLQIIINIIKEYYKIGFIHEVKIWLDQGFKLLESEEKHKDQYIELMFYQYIVNGFPDGFEKFVLETAIPYYENIKQYHSIVLFSKKLGDYYQQRKKYQEAATSFAIANSAYEKILKL
ncbi:tetratricopeptide repeat protein [Heyndrickxia sp. NPDC080065]|uniref:helix-turn-helix domain-containing protein n=1 Tax=Heyndrickxia sp. NPDC080065 TaxID=3390568 RepID=UPI003D019D03